MGGVTHGHTRNYSTSREYNTWLAMRYRCYNKKGEKYPTYGGVGITVCDRWRDSFELFLEDMGPRPTGCTLDRYPNRDGNYEPGNCRWATAKEQCANRKPFTLPRKTHCPSGHPYSGKNVHICVDGYPKCRECDRIRAQRIRDEIKAKRLAETDRSQQESQ